MSDSSGSDDWRSHWDIKCTQGLPSLETPDPFFISAFDRFVADRFPNGGLALDLAGGVGRHALWLARKNWTVTVIDISEVAIRQLGQKMRQQDLSLELLALDANEYSFKPARFDLIVMFDHVDREICSRVVSAMKRGGFLISKSALNWEEYEGNSSANTALLRKNENCANAAGTTCDTSSGAPRT
jgi:2-polyprenyl-3-methyl-5-hydroxy-6-metoxy-1,4-benzoquinol methylase